MGYTIKEGVRTENGAACRLCRFPNAVVGANPGFRVITVVEGAKAVNPVSKGGDFQQMFAGGNVLYNKLIRRKGDIAAFPAV